MYNSPYIVRSFLVDSKLQYENLKSLYYVYDELDGRISE